MGGEPYKESKLLMFFVHLLFVALLYCTLVVNIFDNFKLIRILNSAI